MYDEFLIVRNYGKFLQNFFKVHHRLSRRWDFCCIFDFLLDQLLEFVLIHYMFTICSLYIHYMFTIYSLYVHYIFTILRRWNFCRIFDFLLEQLLEFVLISRVDKAFSYRLIHYVKLSVFRGDQLEYNSEVTKSQRNRRRQRRL